MKKYQIDEVFIDADGDDRYPTVQFLCSVSKSNVYSGESFTVTAHSSALRGLKLVLDKIPAPKSSSK